MSCQQCTGALPAGRPVAARRAQPVRPGPRRHRARRTSSTRRACFAGRWRPGSRRARRPAALPGQGEARHLPVHGRRAVADRDVRLQADAQRSATARSCPTRCARASGSPACPATSRRCRSPARSSSSRSTAAAARGSASCCRTRRSVVDDLVLRPVDAHRGDQPRPGDHVLPDRLADRRPAEHRARGFTTASAARTRTCRRSSC